MSALPPEDDVLAGEVALRLLDEGELDRARAREAADPIFAAAVADWDARLMPWLDGIEPVAPDADLWARIAAVLAQGRPATDGTASDGNVVALRRKVRNWRVATAGVTALAASLALVVGLRGTGEAPPAAVTPARASDLAIAAVTPEGETAALAVVSYDRVSASLIVTPAGLVPVPGRSHELWVVPATGTPKSLGVIAGRDPRRIVLADDLAAFFAGAATIAISTEQQGGSRTGLPVGPIVGSGTLRRI